MTDQLSPEVAALLEAARQNHGPTEDDRQRVLLTLHRSLGIGLPVALTATAGAGLSGGQGAAATGGASSLAGTQAAGALPGAGAVTSSAGASSLSGTSLAGAAQLSAGAVHGVTQVAPSATQAALGLFGKLVTWKAGKLLLAGAALSSAVGIGSSVVPRLLQDSPELSSKAGSATAFATATADAGRSTAPAPTSPAEREPSALAAPAVERVLERADQPAARAQAIDDELPPALAALPETESVATPALRMPRGTTRGHHKHGKRVTIRSAPSARASGDKSVGAAVEPVTPAATQAAQPTQSTEVESPHELTLIRRALTSLRDGQPAQALAQLDEHAARYPTGSFSTERRGLHVVALCAAGRTDEGERERAAFLKSSASSPIAARVRSACSEHDD